MTSNAHYWLKHVDTEISQLIVKLDTRSLQIKLIPEKHPIAT